jgi:hypothetical protein
MTNIGKTHTMHASCAIRGLVCSRAGLVLMLLVQVHRVTTVILDATQPPRLARRCDTPRQVRANEIARRNL